MKFTIQQSELKRALAAVQGVAERRTTIPVLSNALVASVGDGLLQITATDLDTSITVDAVANIETQGGICLPTRKLFDIVRNLPDGDVVFALDDKAWMTVTCGRSKTRFAAIGQDNFPEIEKPKPGTDGVSVKGDVWKEMAKTVAYSISDELSRFSLAGAKCEVADGQMRLISTDRNRLSYIQSVVEGNMDALVPRKALSEVAKLEGDIQISESKHSLFFVTEGTTLIARKTTGTFPAYRMIMPDEHAGKVTVNAEEFASCLRRSSLMASEIKQSVLISLTKDEMQITSQSMDLGESCEILDANYTGEDVEFGFNWHYLMDFLTVAPKESQVSLSFGNKCKNVECNIVGNSDYRYIIQPLNLS